MPCLRQRYGDAPDTRSPVIRPDDWRYERLYALILAYDGEAAARAILPASLEQGAALTAEDYAQAVARLFATLERPAPALPEPLSAGQGWDGACQRNDYGAAARYLDAIAADRALAPHAAPLVTWRTRLIGSCPEHREQVDALIEEIEAATPGAAPHREAALYLVAIAHFYSGRAEDAVTGFLALTTARNAWVAETARYMVGRALLVASQKNWDGYWEFERIDQTQLAAARDAFDRYLGAHPQGVYAPSARGLARRIAYLSGSGATLNRLAIEDFQRAYEAKDYGAIARTGYAEITNYLDLAAFTLDDFPFDRPVLAAVLRPHVPLLSKDASGAVARLLRVKPRYAAFPGLYELLAVPLLGAAGRADEALALAAPANAPPAVRDGVLYERAALLEAEGRYREARVVLRGLAQANPGLALDDAFVADIFRLHLTEGAFDDALEPGSPFHERLVAEDLFERVPSEDVLRSIVAAGATAPQSAAPAAASRELMFRMLRERRWADFVALYDGAGKPAPFTEVETAARSLVRDPADAKGLFNAGYFLHQRQGTSGDCCPCERLPEPLPARSDEGVAPIALYVDALAALDDGRDEALEARVLHYAILCFKASTDAYACQRGVYDEVPESTRARWFRKLKTKYAKSPWAEKTPYYY